MKIGCLHCSLPDQLHQTVPGFEHLAAPPQLLDGVLDLVVGEPLLHRMSMTSSIFLVCKMEWQ